MIDDIKKRKQAHLYIKGDVIGVGFRAWVKIQSKIFHVTGWVRNVYNDPHRFGKLGGVEAVFQGDGASVEKAVFEVKKGSPVSRVDDVEVFWQKPSEVFEGFEIRK